MARHGNSRHVKRLAASGYSKPARKASTYLVKPNPGRHSLEDSVALLALVRDKFGIAANAAEARKIIGRGMVEVNGAKVTEPRYPVGFGDTITLAGSGESYSIGIARHGVIGVEKLEGKKGSRMLKVIGRYLARGGSQMLRLHDGSVMKDGKGAGVNDTVVLSGNGIEKVLKFEEGAQCLVISGTHAAERGSIAEIKKGNASSPATVTVQSGSGQFKTLVGNVMVVGA